MNALVDHIAGSLSSLGFFKLVSPEEMKRFWRDLLARASRLRGSQGSAALTVDMETAGAWLRAFHGIPPLPHTRVREASRKEFIESIHRFVDFLASAHAQTRLMSRVASVAEASALDCLPRTLPLATSHGDLAPRNILIEP